MNQQYSKNPETYQAETFEEGLFIQVSANTLTCNRQSITLTAFSERPDLQINWSGFAPNLNPVTVSEPGIYKVTAIDTQSGLYKTNSIEIFQNIKVPQGVTASNTGQITCDSTTVHLIGNSTTEGVSYEWTTTDPFSGVTKVVADTRVAQVDFPGIYTLVVTKISNGCTNTANTTVYVNQLTPDYGIINPSSPPVQNEVDTLRAVVQSGVSYEWSVVGTDWLIKEGATSSELIYTAGQANTTASFTLVTRYDDNGCTSTDRLDLTAEAAKNAESFALMNIEDDIQVSAYPNPFEDHALIEFTSKKDDYVTVSLFNLNGQLVKTLFESDAVGQTLYQVPIDGTNMQPGTYYYTVQTKDKVYTETIFLVR